MSGRRRNPGERGIEIAVEPQAILNRTIRAQVSKVANADGYVTLEYDGLPSGGKHATVAPLWMSFPDPKAGGPAWGRFMPQVSDLVKVAFDYEDNPKIVGYDIEASKVTNPDPTVGWTPLHDQYTKCAAGENDSRPQFANFVPLNPGEFDFMSSGGSYIYGNNKGRLYMQGGPVSIALIKNQLKLIARAQLTDIMSDASELKFGQVRRTQADGTEKTISTDVNGAYKEFNVSVGPSADTLLASFKMGNVCDDTQVTTSPSGNPVYAQLEVYGAANQANLQLQIDSLGNVALSGETAKFVTMFDSQTFNAASDIIIDAKTSVEVRSAAIKLGATAANPLFLTNTYGPAEQVMVDGLSTAIQNLSTALNSLCVVLSASMPGVAVPGPGAATAAAAIATAAGVAIAECVAVSTAASASAQVFNNNYPNYFSKTSKTD